MRCTVCQRYGHDDPACTVKPGSMLGTYAGGILTLDDLRGRCRVESAKSCWIWVGATTSGKRGTVLPVAWYAPKRRIMSVPRLAWELSGKKPAPMNWRTCGNEMCCNPKHLEAGTRAEWGAWVAARGRMRGDPQRTAINTRTRRLRAETMTAELAAWVRDSEQTGREIAHAVGVSETSICRIRKLRQWAPEVRVSSVFSLAANMGQMRRQA